MAFHNVPSFERRTNQEISRTRIAKSIWRKGGINNKFCSGFIFLPKKAKILLTAV
jgi:hypothetical protein